MKRLLGMLIPVVAVLGFYAWTSANGMTFGLGLRQDGYYNLMTRGLLAGRTDIETAPDPRLFELQNPYDPRPNTALRLHDASLYKGRYYLYWGLAPAVTLFIPWRLVGLGDLPEAAAALAFGSGAFLFGLLILERIVRWHIPAAPHWLRTISILVLGIANVIPFILRGAAVYEVAISAGACFLLGSAFFALTAAETGELRLGRLVLAGLLAGLAFASRPNHLFALPFLAALALVGAHPTRRGRLTAGVAGLTPFVLVAVAVALFNHARFGSFTEFGTRYQLAGTHPLFFRFFDPSALGPGLYFYLFAPPALRLDFPHVVLQRGFAGELPPGYLPADLVAGVFTHAPLVLILLAAFPILARLEDRAFRSRVLILAGLGLSLLVLTSVAVPAAVQRYEADFVSPLLIASLALWLTGLRLASGGIKAGAVTLFLLLASWTLAANTAFSLRGFFDALAYGNPPLWSRLERTFAPARPFVGRLVRDARATVRLRVALTQRSADELEPLLASGTAEAQDVLFVRRLTPSRSAFVLRLADGTVASSGPVDLAPLRFHALEVRFDRVAGETRVAIDGREVARLEGRLLPLDVTRLLPGRGARGKGARDLGQFSGAFVTEDMELAADDGLQWLPPLLGEPSLLLPSMDSLPAKAKSGQLAVLAGADGARIFDGSRWRWIPMGALDSVCTERLLPDGEASDEVPLVVSAGLGHHRDLVTLIRLPGGRSRVVLRTAAGPRVEGEPGTWKSGEAVVVCLDGVARTVEVTVGGDLALRAEADLLPLRPQRLDLP